MVGNTYINMAPFQSPYIHVSTVTICVKSEYSLKVFLDNLKFDTHPKGFFIFYWDIRASDFKICVWSLAP